MYRMQVYDRRDDRHALAEAQGRRGPGARLRAGGPPHGGRRRDRLRSGDGLLGDRAAAAGRLGVSLRRVPAGRGRAAGRRRRPWTCSCRPRPRSCSRATSIRRSAGARARSATTPASTRSTTTSRSSTSPRSRGARSPIYLTTIVGRPPMEDGFMGEAVERLFLPLVQKTIPEIVDMHLPVEGIFHNLDDRVDRQAVPGPRAQDDARDLGHGPDDVHQDDRRRRRGRGRPRRGRGRSGGR